MDIITVGMLVLLTILHFTLALYAITIRFSHAGRVCSGDFSELRLTQFEDFDDEGILRLEEHPVYLVNMGFFLKVYGTVFGVVSCCLCCSLCVAGRLIYKT